jgi:hypothetical protein
MSKFARNLSILIVLVMFGVALALAALPPKLRWKPNPQW